MRSGCDIRARRRRVMASLFLAAVWTTGSGGWAEEEMAQASATSPQKLTLQFQGVDILEVLKLLAEQSGFNLVAGRNVSGRVTLFVKEVDPWEAFEVILAANDLAYEQRGQILNIMTQRDYELVHGQPYRDRRILKSLTPRYAKVADLSRALAQVKSNIGRVIADEATNTLILFDTPALVEQMTQLAGQMDQPLETKVFGFNYGVAKNLTPLLQEALTKGVGRISVDERTNQAVVTDYPQKLREIGRMVEAFDEKSTQVLIEAKIVQVTLSEKFQLGIDWEVLARENIPLKVPAGLKLTSGGSVGFSQTAVAQAGDYKVLLEALALFGDTQVLSEPRLTVVNNQEAKILVGSKEPYVTKSVSQTGTGTAVTSESVTFLDVGVKLFVTPTITRDRFVLMKVRPEVSSSTRTLETSEKNVIPIVDTAEAETVLMVEDGATVILGGLIKDEQSLDRAAVPILGKIPWVGALFRSTKESSKKTELVLLLSPRIITGKKEEASLQPPKRLAALDENGYFVLVMDLVQAAAKTQGPLARGRGTALVQFTVRPDGRLRGSPSVVAAEHRALEAPARRAVLAAAPFPPFPEDFKREPQTFKVPITFDH